MQLVSADRLKSLIISFVASFLDTRLPRWNSINWQFSWVRRCTFWLLVLFSSIINLINPLRLWKSYSSDRKDYRNHGFWDFIMNFRQQIASQQTEKPLARTDIETFSFSFVSKVFGPFRENFGRTFLFGRWIYCSDRCLKVKKSLWLFYLLSTWA